METPLISSLMGVSRLSSQVSKHRRTIFCTRQSPHIIILHRIIGNISYLFVCALACLHVSTCSWSSTSILHRGHLWDSVAPGDIFFFWFPVFCQPWMCFKHAMCWRGPSVRNAPFMVLKSMLSCVVSLHPCLSLRYTLCLFLGHMFWSFDRSEMLTMFHMCIGSPRCRGVNPLSYAVFLTGLHF
jgi:hypothetical protein